MLPVRIRRSARPLLLASALALVVTGCSVGSVGSSGGDASGSGEATTISVLYSTGTANDALMKALGDGFTAANPNIKITFETQPGGTEGDNLVKTSSPPARWPTSSTTTPARCSRRSNPTRTWSTSDRRAVRSTAHRRVQAGGDRRTAAVRRARRGTSMGGGVLYNKKIYADLGLTVPTTWAEFMANNEKIKAAGKVAPVDPDLRRHLDLAALRARRLLQRPGRDPDLAEDYTANKAKYADEPAARRASSTRGGLQDGLLQQGLRLGQVRRRHQEVADRRRRRTTRC